MTTEIQVTMLGYRGTGKTSYLLATAHEMQRSRDDFALDVLNTEDANDLEARWAALVSTPHQWPSGDYTFTRHDFRLTFGLDTVATFTWVDHQGGIASWNHSTDVESRDDLINLLARSHCIFLCLPGDIISDFRSRPEQLPERLEMASLRRILGEAKRRRASSTSKPFAVAVLITKADYLDDDLEGALNYVISQVRWLQPERSLIQGSQHPAGIFPVRLGEDLRDRTGAFEPSDVEDPILSTVSSRSRRFWGAIEPSDVEGPILFAAWAQERQRIADAYAGLATIDPNREADALNRLHALGSGLDGFPILIERAFLSERQKTEPPSRRIFISHSGTDVKFCKSLKKALEARGADVWYDRDNLGARQIWGTITNELNTRSITVLVLSKAAFNSPYVREEFDMAHAFGSYRPRGPRTIVAVTAEQYSEEDLNNCAFLKDFPIIEQTGHIPWPIDIAIEKTLQNLEIDLISDNAQDLVVSGNNLVAQGQHGKAITHFERALELDSTNIVALTGLAYAYLVAGDPVNGLIVSRRACDLDQRNARAWALLGASYYGRGADFLEEAQSAYRNALALDPYDADAWSDLGMILYDLERDSEALSAIKKALDFDASVAYRWHIRGDIQSRMGQVDAARESYARAIEIDGRIPLDGYAGASAHN